ncbi:MAG: endonuclease III [Nanoarchaeota archaeon]|nr:endonuclease III [Nanoarchaeota archaeon]
MDEITALKQLAELERLGKKPGELRLAAESWGSPFQILISTIMSARTRDEVTIKVAEKLFKKYPTAEKLSEAELSDLEELIKPVNFYRNKSKNILNCAKVLFEEHRGKVPTDLDSLVSLPGVGRKTANVFLSEIGDDAIGVDTHVAHISGKLGWTKHPPESAHKIESNLKELFSKKHWGKINPTLVRFGKTHTSRKEKDELLGEVRKIR